MNKIIFFRQVFPVLLLFTYSIANAQFTPQQNEQLGNALGEMFGEISNASKEGRANKLYRQKEAMLHLTSALNSIENDNIKDAAKESGIAIKYYPKYSIPYLISAYGAVEEGDFLQSNRMLKFYSKRRNKKINNSLNGYIPIDFTEEIIKKSNVGFSKLTKKYLRKRYKQESWLNQTVEIFIAPSADFFNDNDNFGTVNYWGGSSLSFPSVVSDNNVSIVYKKYFWFNRANSFPDFNNNFGIVINGGVNTNISLPSDDYGATFPKNLSVFVAPGFHLKRFYIVPIRISYSKVFNYSEKSPIYIIPNPEIRFYPNFLNPLAQDGRKVANNSEVGGYLFFKIPYTYFYGETGNDSYKQEKIELLVGFAGVSGKRNGITGSVGLGYGTNSIEQYVSMSNNSFSLWGSYYKLEVSVGIRIF